MTANEETLTEHGALVLGGSGGGLFDRSDRGRDDGGRKRQSD